MSNIREIRAPDLGGADDVETIEILVTIGDQVKIDDPLVTVESEKASMDIPSEFTGTITELKVELGDKIHAGQIIGLIDAESDTSIDASQKQPQGTTPPESPTTTNAKPQARSTTPQSNKGFGQKLVVIGSGPGGYTAAFRAADLGLDVTLIEKYPALGGVCLNVGCIPSKALLHSASVIANAREMAAHGIEFGEPSINLDKLRGFKTSVVTKLTDGLASMAKARNVNIVQGYANFASANSITVENSQGNTQHIEFDQAIIAAGSRVTVLPTFDFDDERIIDSTGALELSDIPNTMLIVGGGIIGLEMATVYSELGTQVTIVEYMPQIVPGADKDLVAPLLKRLKNTTKAILTNTKVEKITPQKAGIKVSFSSVNSEKTIDDLVFDRVLIATGRRPNGDLIQAENAGIQVDERGFIPVDAQMRTNLPHIFAIGDVVGQPMLAHKATHEAKVAAEVCAGLKSGFEASVIPSVAYTDPEIAWVGLTETEAKAKGIKFEKANFPWAASGRALGNDRAEGKTKLLFDPQTERVLGGGIVGQHAGDLIAEIALAIEMGADASDIGLTIHPHPTLSETIAFAAEVQEGTITDLYIPKKNIPKPA